MQSLDRVLQGLATAAAMLTCVAVVLNIGPFANSSNMDGLRGTIRGPAAPGIMQQANGSSSISRQEDDAHSPPLHSQSAVERVNVSEPIEPAIRTSSLPVFELAASASQPVRRKDGGDEIEVKPRWQDAGSVDPDTRVHQNHGSSDLMKGDAIVGVWAPDAGTCSARNFRDGTLPTVINTDGAWAGETFCMFTKKEKTETGWRVVAKCSNPREHWTSNVRLTVSEKRLTWTSKRGTQAYTRCESDVLMAQAK